MHAAAVAGFSRADNETAKGIRKSAMALDARKRSARVCVYIHGVRAGIIIIGRNNERAARNQALDAQR